MANLPKVSAGEFLDAVKEGVREAVYDAIRNATDMPTADFFDSIKQGVKEAIMEMRPDITALTKE